MRHILPVSGKDSLAAALVQLKEAPTLPYEFLFCDVGAELPETYAWLREVEKALGISIVRIGRSLEEVIREQNMLPSHHRRFCTKYCKIFPIQKFIGKGRATQYLGVRADEDHRVGAGFRTGADVTPRYPLAEAEIGLPEVYGILEEHGVTPPTFFWDRLYDEVWSSCDSKERRVIDGLSSWSRNGMFAWRSRSNCFNCFYQRRYEWAGLLEHHPDLFERAERTERNYGYASVNKTLKKDFYWVRDLPLKELKARADRIFARRVSKVRRALRQIGNGDRERVEEAVFPPTTCGLYCGK